MENSECETSQEITGRQQTSDRAQRESSAVLQEVRNVLQLGNVVLAVATVVDKQREDVVVLPASMCFVELCEIVKDHPPGLNLLIGVVDMGQRLSVAVVERQIGKVLATSTVSGIGETRMVRVQFTSVR